MVDTASMCTTPTAGADASATESDDSTTSAGPLALLQPNNPKFPSEVISHIISCSIPEDGLCLSNDPEYAANLKTIRSLLKTNLSIKRETLRQIFKKPLNVYITSGKRCGCSQMTHDNLRDAHASSKLLRIFFSLPLRKWPRIRILLTPKIRSLRVDMCITLGIRRVSRTIASRTDVIFCEPPQEQKWDISMLYDMALGWIWPYSVKRQPGIVHLELPKDFCVAVLRWPGSQNSALALTPSISPNAKHLQSEFWGWWFQRTARLHPVVITMQGYRLRDRADWRMMLTPSVWVYNIAFSFEITDRKGIKQDLSKPLWI